MTQETHERPPDAKHPCPEDRCSVRAQTFGSLLSHLKSDHGVHKPLERYGGDDD